METFFTKIKNIFNVEEKTAISPYADYLLFNQDMTEYLSYSDQKQAIEGYCRNIVAHRCIKLIADQASLIEYKIYSGEKELKTHNLKTLLESPYFNISKTQFIQMWITYFLIYGNTYIWMKDKDVSENYVKTPPINLYPLRPDFMNIVEGKNFMPALYSYRDNYLNINFITTLDGKSNIIHTKDINPINEFTGLSTVRPALFSIKQHNEAGQWNYSLFKNGARPSGILTAPADKVLSNDDIDRLRSEIESKYSGSKNTGKPMLLSGGLTWQQVSMTAVDMDYQNTKKSAAADIALAFGVPLELINNEMAKYDNLNAAWGQLWQAQVLPLVNSFCSALNMSLSPRYGNDIKIKLDFSNVPAITALKIDNMNKIENVSFLSLNEKRKLCNEQEMEGGDIVLLKQGTRSIMEDGIIQDLTNQYAYGNESVNTAKENFIQREIKNGSSREKAIKLAEVIYERN